MLVNVLVKPGRTELCKIKTPEPSYGEILIKIRAALTCGTDLKAFLRGHSLIPMPGVFGHEFSGVVAKAGKGVRRFKEGDSVMAVHTAPCLKCVFCGKQLYNLCERIMSTKVLGAFAEYVLLPSHVVKQNLFHKPENISFEEAAFLEPLSCVVHSVEPLKIRKEDSALILGAGPIGLLHLLLLKRKGARVAISDVREERLNVAKRLGADLIFRTEHSPSLAPLPSREGEREGFPSREGRITPSHPPSFPPLVRGELKRDLSGGEGLHVSALLGKNKSAFPSPLTGKKNPRVPSPLVGEGKGEGYTHVNKFTHGIGFDYVFECTGRTDVWETSVNYVRRGGTVILFGGCESGTTVNYDTGRLHYDEITLRGVFHYTPSDVKKAYQLLCKGELGVSRLISGRYPLLKLKEAFGKLARGLGIKYAIIP